MPKFIYKAKTSPTDIIEGTVTADSKASAIQKLSNKGYYLISINEYIGSKRSFGKKKALFNRKITLRDITNFTRQLSDLLESGLTIVKALDILSEQVENRRLSDVITDIKQYCVDGNPLSNALARHPDLFSDMFISMVRSGEAGGALGRSRVVTPSPK